MPEIYLDGELFKFEGDLSRWDELLQEIYKKAGSQLRGIAKIMGDGEDITSIISGTPFKKTPDELQKIEITTRKISDIAESGIENVKKFIPDLLKILKGASEFLRTGEKEKKDQAISGGLEGIKLIITLFINLHNLYKFDLNNIKLNDGSTVSEKFEALNRVFEIFNNAQKKQDDIEAADIIEYELIPLIESFSDVFEQIRKIIEQDKKVN